MLASTSRRSSRPEAAASVAVVAPPVDPVRHFGRWVAASTPRGAAVLNVGGGCDASGELPGIRRRATTLVVVDPSPRVFGNTRADERHRMTLEDFSTDHQDRFDVAFAVFVLEHVAEPMGFTEAAARVLKPGGLFMALTVNQWHYFGLTAWATSRLGVDEWLLRRLRDPAEVEEYHVRTEYRINTVRSIRRHLGSAGFSTVELRVWDSPHVYEPYLPGRLTAMAAAWSRTVYRLDRPGLMGHLSLKAVLDG